MAWDIDTNSRRPYIEIDRLASANVAGNSAHVRGYGTAFERTISSRISGHGTVLAWRTAQRGSYDMVGGFEADLEYSQGPNLCLGVVEAFEASTGGPVEDRQDGVPIVLG